MGELVRYLSRISSGYNIYIVVVVNRYGNTAEKVINENFETLAFDIGEEAVISKLMGGEGIKEAEEKFEISDRDLRPVLVITQTHPNEWKKGMPAIKIQLGKIDNENQVRDFLFRLSRLIRSEDFGGTKWLNRREMIKRFAEHLPIVVDLIGLAV